MTDHDTTEVDREDDGGALPEVATLFAKLQLPMPPILGVFAEALTEMAPTVFSTRSDLTSLGAFDALVDEAAAGRASPYLALSYEGHGITNWHVRYALVMPGLAVFIQLPFGGVHGSELSDRAAITEAFAALADRVQSADVQAAETLVIDHRGFEGSRWCLAGKGGWTADLDALTTAAAA